MLGFSPVTAARTLASVLIALAGVCNGAQTEPETDCQPTPVYLVISGVTFDRERMAAYGQALADTGMYARLGAYYLNAPRPIEVLEGSPPDNYVTLVVWFPSLAAVRSFWNSDAYQNRVMPLRLDPPAADYTVAVYQAADLPAYLQSSTGPRFMDMPTDCGVKPKSSDRTSSPRGTDHADSNS